MLVLASLIAVLAQVVPKRQGASLLVSTRLNDVHMVCVRPGGRPMKERAEGIVRVRHVDVVELSKPRGVGVDRVKPLH
jgi:hypothetical protein